MPSSPHTSLGGHRYKKSTACLMSIKQREDETLRSYITRFNKEALSIDEADDKILVAAFTNGLRKGKFLFSLYKNDPKTMFEVLYRATKYMNAEDALLAREDKPRKRKRLEDARQDQGRKKPRTGDRCDERRSKPPGGRFITFIPLNADQGRRGPNVFRKAEKRSNQAIKKQVLSFPP